MGAKSKIKKALSKVAGKVSPSLKKKAIKAVGTVAKIGVKVAGGATLGKATLGIAAVGLAAKAVKKGVSLIKGRKKGTTKQRRRMVPKAVSRWTSKVVRKRKIQDKILRKLFSASGAARMMKSRSSGSRGTITAAEAAGALRR